MMRTAERTDPVPAAAGRVMMQAIVQRRYGTAPEDVLRLEQIARPAIKAGEVLVRVRAAGVDRGTWHLMTGQPYLMRIIGFGLRGPKTPVPGWAVAGTVEAVGQDVTGLEPGDEVFGPARGSFAQFATAPANRLAAKPAGLTFEQAAALPGSAATALQALRDHAHLRPGQHVLVIGASGGVGTFAVQLAKAFGAEVTGVSSTAKADLVRAVGADHVLDYTREDPVAGSQRYDGNAGHHRRRGRRPLAGRDRPQPPGAVAVPVRAAEADRLRHPPAPRRPGDPAGPGRLRSDHPGHRPDLPARPGRGRRPSPGRGPRPGQGRHQPRRTGPPGK